MTTKLTVICRETEYRDQILIYVVDVENAGDQEEIEDEVTEARLADLGDEFRDEIKMEILFAFAGDVACAEDWRI